MKRLRPFIVAVILFFSLVTQLWSDMLMKDYLRLKNTKEAEIFLTGYLDGIRWANAWLEGEKRPLLFCPPSQLTLNAGNLKQIVDDYYENHKLRYEKLYKEEIYLSPIAFFALREAFSCK